jgi:hypothetical protein
MYENEVIEKIITMLQNMVYPVMIYDFTVFELTIEWRKFPTIIPIKANKNPPHPISEA